MGKKTDTAPSGMVQKQTLYMVALVALTAGFMLGAAYTSFKLADSQQVQAQAPNSQGPQQTGGKPDNRASNEIASAIFKLEQHLKEKPEDAGAWAQLGHLFFDSDRYSDAIEAYDRSLAIAPNDPAVITNQGVMYRRSGNPQKAIECFDRAIAAVPDFEIARFNKGIVLMHDIEDIDGAVKAWEGLLEINPMATAPNGQLIANLVKGLKEPAN